MYRARVFCRKLKLVAQLCIYVFGNGKESRGRRGEDSAMQITFATMPNEVTCSREVPHIAYFKSFPVNGYPPDCADGGWRGLI